MNKRGVSFTKGKAKNTKYTFKRLKDYLFKFRYLLILALILTIISNLLSLICPKITGEIMDLIELGEGKINLNKVYCYSFWMLVCYLMASFSSLILAKIMIRISKKIVYAMRKDAYDKMMQLPVAYFDRNSIGDVISRLSYDIDTVNTSLSSDLIQIVTSIMTIVGALIMMIIVSKILVLVFVITLPISLMFTKIMVKKTSKYFKNRSKQLGILNGYTEEMITGLKTIKVYGKEQIILDNFNQYNVTAANASYLAEYYSAYTGPGVNFVNNLSLSLICLFGAILNHQHLLSIGKISSFVLYSKKFSGPINEIANIIVDIQSALAAAERVFELIDEPAELKDSNNAVELSTAKGEIEFKNVYFGYYPEQMILKNVSFQALEKKMVAIVGPTGSGKTTIVNLLMRFYDINSGSINLDNHNIELITRSSLRNKYAMVLQDTWLFEGTIYDNLAYGRDNITIEEVKQAAKLALVDTLIEKMPNGYQTIITEGGSNISKGQKQLLTIARAMLLDAKILILDEATSSVDTRTEIKINLAMKELMKNKTSFIIAHRLSTIQNADLILVVKDGNVIEQGTHQTLLKQNGFYAELYNSQFN